MADLPDWTLDLVAAVEEFEDTHPKVDVCLGSALADVPADVRAEARGWARAKRRSEPAKSDAQESTFEAGSSLHAERANGPTYIDPHQGDVRRAGFQAT